MKALLVLPTYNEAGSIREVIDRSLSATASIDVLVVDDGSPDGTGKIADEISASNPRVKVLHRPRKSGLGPAYLAGFREGLRQGYDAMIEMDSDLSHDPSDLARFVEAAERSDLVIGSRYIPGGGVSNWSRMRLVLSKAGNLYARALLRFPLTDATSGYRCFRREVLEALPLGEVGSEGYTFQIEMAWRAWSMGFRVSEIPIQFSERREGSSKMSNRIVFEALGRVMKFAARGRRPPKAPHARSVASKPSQT
ncbi:MAG: polyprenol monophosphomannose synthase [Actinomycetota bacterium]